MHSTHDVAVFVGSLREGSYSRLIAKTLMEVAPESLSLRFVEIGDLPLYNEDTETDNPPAAWTEFRNQVGEADALLFVTPEYNRSVPAALKNALDVGSRPYGQSVWAGKPSGVVSTSMGSLAGFGANHHLRQSLVFLDSPTMQQPEAYLGSTPTLFDEQGNLVNEGTREFLRTFMEAYANWVETVVNVPAAVGAR